MTNHPLSIFRPTTFWRITVLTAILVCGFTTRLYDLTDPPLDYASTRQLRSAIIARGIYYGASNDVPAWEKEVALKEKDRQEQLEPAIFETLVGYLYLISGKEFVWFARILSSFFWILGGLALFKLSRELSSYGGAVISLVYYLFGPFSLLASRTFQPDPLMTAAIIWTWYSFFQWSKARSGKWAWITGLVAGTAILIKSTAIFFLFFGMAAVVLSENNFRELRKDYQIWLIAALSALPTIIYYLYGYFISGIITDQFKGRLFNPELWGHLNFYKEWLGTTSDVLGHLTIFLAALVGLILVREKRSRRFLIGSWVGFTIYGFAVSYYVTTHSYYLLPAVPLAAITLGAVADWIISWLKKAKMAGLAWSGIIAILISGVALGYYIYHREDYRHEPAYYAKVASYVSPKDKIIALSQDYGFRLAYYGWINTQPWSRLDNQLYSGQAANDEGQFSRKFSSAVDGYDFFIITRMEEFRKKTELKSQLSDHYQVLVEGGGYLIYDLRERLD